MKKYLLALLIPVIALAGYYGSGGGSSSGGGTWGSITGTLSSQTDLQTELDGKVNDTGNETVAGIKTFSSAPIMSALSAQAMPYLNASKALANGGWTQADTTFATTFTPTGSPTSALALALGSATAPTYGLRITNGEKAAANALRIESAYTNADSISNVSIATSGTSSANFLWGIRSTNTATCVGDALGYNIGGAMCSGITAISGAGSAGTNAGVYGSAYGGLHNYGGAFQGVAAGAGAGNRTVGVHATASGENSAQVTGIFTKIRSANSSSDLENEDPGFSGGLVVDNGDTGRDIMIALQNGSSTFHVAGNGVTIIGPIGTTNRTHQINGTVVAHSGSGTPTLGTGNAPVNGDPATWLKIRINGTNYVIPAWTAP